jgi:hypothetical protein
MTHLPKLDYSLQRSIVTWILRSSICFLWKSHLFLHLLMILFFYHSLRRIPTPGILGRGKRALRLKEYTLRSSFGHSRSIIRTCHQHPGYSICCTECWPTRNCSVPPDAGHDRIRYSGWCAGCYTCCARDACLCFCLRLIPLYFWFSIDHFLCSLHSLTVIYCCLNSNCCVLPGLFCFPSLHPLCCFDFDLLIGIYVSTICFLSTVTPVVPAA